nr:hypothetical protein Q903MT_gene6380 [Picea sitchensis]
MLEHKHMALYSDLLLAQMLALDNLLNPYHDP